MLAHFVHNTVQDTILARSMQKASHKTKESKERIHRENTLNPQQQCLLSQSNTPFLPIHKHTNRTIVWVEEHVHARPSTVPVLTTVVNSVLRSQ
jgi:hypothetical protein